MVLSLRAKGTPEWQMRITAKARLAQLAVRRKLQRLLAIAGSYHHNRDPKGNSRCCEAHAIEKLYASSLPSVVPANRHIRFLQW